tara:strand:+ start:857 stop:1324 length:468 start_codon:yes stop_codon:yes gene_type:complete
MKIAYLIIMAFLISGCQTVTNLTDEHAHSFETAISSQKDFPTNTIRVEMDEGLAGSLMNVYFERVTKTVNEDFLYVRGPIRKPLGKSLSTAHIRATFYNEQEEILSQKITKVIPSRTHLNRGLKGRFSIKSKYDPEITRCKLEIKWKKSDVWVTE